MNESTLVLFAIQIVSYLIATLMADKASTAKRSNGQGRAHSIVEQALMDRLAR